MRTASGSHRAEGWRRRAARADEGGGAATWSLAGGQRLTGVSRDPLSRSLAMREGAGGGRGAVMEAASGRPDLPAAGIISFCRSQTLSNTETNRAIVDLGSPLLSAHLS